MKDKFGFNDGDILVIRNWILIYAGCQECMTFNRIQHAIKFHALFNIRSHSIDTCPNGPRPGIGYIETNPEPRYATNNEIKIFFEKIENDKYVKWDFKNKRFKPIKEYEYVC